MNATPTNAPPPNAMPDKHLVVFTDLDGTLLDHDDYGYAEALPAIATLQARGVPLVIVTSKTRPEIEALRAALHVLDPFAPENGAAVIWPAHGTRFVGSDTSNAEVRAFGPSYADIRAAIARVRADTGLSVRGFGDASAEEVAGWTGLCCDAAALAKQRIGTEPIHLPADPIVRARVRAALENAGLRSTEGGRFVHAIGPFDKGTAVRHMLERYRQHFPNATLRSAACGDSPNDLPMLEAVDYPVVVPRAHGTPLSLTHARGYTARAPGARGFADGIRHVLSLFDQEREENSVG